MRYNLVARLILLILIIDLNSPVYAKMLDKSVNKNSILSFCAGNLHACGVFDNKDMKCWGSRESWGDSASRADFLDLTDDFGFNLPVVDVGNSVDIEQIACGGSHTCIGLSTGEMKCLGWNMFAQVGMGSMLNIIGAVTGYIGDNLPTVNIGSDLRVLEIELGQAFSCVVVTGNKVKCFGSNNYGELGQGHKNIIGNLPDQMGDALAYTDLGVNVEVASIFSGVMSNHACAILSNPESYAQRFKCWGINNNYQLGYGDQKNRGDLIGEMGDNLPLVDLGIESRVNKISLGFGHTCALIINNSLKCWGNGSNGQLGSGSIDTISAIGNDLPLVLIDSGRTIKYISTGKEHNCIVYDDSLTMKCFGSNFIGQLGQPDDIQRGGSPETMIPFIPAINLEKGSLQIVSVQSGRYRNCLVFSDFSLKCFGEGDNGRLALDPAIRFGEDPIKYDNNVPNFVEVSATLPICGATTKEDCLKSKRCVWKSAAGVGMCLPFNCGFILSKERCYRNEKCEWKQKICQFKA